MSKDDSSWGKRRVWLLPTMAVLAALFALFASVETPLAQSGTCIDDVTGVTNNCTANDVRIAVLYNETDVTCYPGEAVTLHLRAELVANASERYDIGMFVATDGGDARTGTCERAHLPPPLSPNATNPTPTCSASGDPCAKDADCPSGETCVGGYIPGENFPGSAGGPFFNAEFQEDPADLCGDLEQGVFTYHDLNSVTVVCSDSDGDGFMDIGGCVSWDNTKGATCLTLEDAVPNTKAKCNCETVRVGNVEVPKVLEVVKDLVPDDDPGAFDLQIDGTTYATDAGDGDSTLPQEVNVGAHTAGELAGTNTDLLNYTSSISCYDRVGRCSGDTALHCVTDLVCATNEAGLCEFPNPVVAECQNCTSVSVDVPNDLTNILCTITNTRQQGSIELKKVWSGTPGSTTLQIGTTAGGTEIASQLVDGADGTTGANTVAPSTYYVSETDPGDYDTTLACTRNGEVYTPGLDDSVVVGSNDVVVCTYTNTRQQGSIELKKVWGGTAGSTTLQIGTAAGGSDVASQLVSGADGSTGAITVDTGTYYVSETDPGPYDTTLACSKNGETYTPGLDDSVVVGSNDVVICTYTNTRQQASIELKKVWVGTPGSTTLKIGTTAGGSEIDSEPVNGTDGTTGANFVDPETYYVSETDPGPYNTSLACTKNGEDYAPGADNAVTVDSNDVVVCTYTNTRQQGSIELKKVWVGTPGSTTLRIGTTAGGSDVDSEFVDGSDGTTGANTVDTGTYYVSETDPGDYDTDLACTKNGEAYVPGASDAVVVGDGDMVVCTYTNTRRQGSIELKKVWVGTAGSTTLRIGTTAGASDVDSEFVDGADGTTGANTVDTGTYYVSETDPGPYGTALACTKNGESYTPGANDSVVVGDGDVVICTYTNTRQQGSIELKKVWSGTPGSTTLKIGTTAGASDVDSEFVDGADGTTGANTVDTGTYYVSETDPGDYGTTLTCTKNGDDYVPGSNDSVVVGDGDVVVCTYTNTRQQGSIELKKVWVGTPGSTTLSIGTTAGASDVDSELIDGADGTTGTNAVDSGTYYVSETDPGPYDADLACTKNGEAYTPGSSDSVVVGDGDVVVCTYTNTRQQGSIELKKVWVGTPGSTTLKIGTTAGTSDIDSEFVDGADGTTGANTVDTGTYYVSETDPGDYDTDLACTKNGEAYTPGGSDSVVVDDGDLVVCTYTNTRQQGSIELKKVWVGTPGSTTLRIGTTADASDVDSEFVDGADGTTGANTVDTGTYYVSETDPGPYGTDLACTKNGESYTPGANDSVVVGDGDAVVCTFTNTRQQGSIELKKVWVGTPGSTTLKIGTTAGASDVDSELVDGADGTTGANNVDTGTYYVSETDPGDYDTELACTKNGESYTPGTNDSVVVGGGDVVVCTYTNTRQQGSIELKKVWVGTPGSTTLKIGTTAGASDVDWELVFGTDGTTDANAVDSGTYYVSETDPGPYDTDLACTKNGESYTPGANDSVVVGDGDVVVCTYTNTRQQGSIELKKVWVGTAGSTTLKIGTTAGASDVDSEVVDGTDGTTGDNTVDTGTYYVSETDPGDYDTELACTKNGEAHTPGTGDSVIVGDGDVLVCTFTNTRQQGSIELKKVWVGTAGSTTLKIGTTAGTSDVDSEVVDGADGTTGANTVDTGTYYVSETDPGPYDTELACTKNGEAYTPGSSDSLGVAKNDVVVCTYTNTRQTGQLEVWKDLEPNDDPGLFNLQIDGITERIDASDWDDTGKKILDTGNHTVGEVDGTNTNLDDYNSSIECKDQAGLGEVVASGEGTGPLDVTVNASDDIACVITNERKTGQLEVVKALLPSDDGGLFNLQIDGVTDPDAQNIGDGGTTGKETLNTGSYTVGETAGTATTLDDYTISISCVDQGGQGTEVASTDGPGPLDLTINEDDDIVCTVTNKSKYGKIIVEKQTDPNGAPDDFAFAGDAAGTIGDGEQIVVDRLLPGTYRSTETLPGTTCSGDQIPEVNHLGRGALLRRDRLYIVKGLRLDIEGTFSNIIWMAQIGESSFQAALVRPTADVTWAENAWDLLSEWREPFTMNSHLWNPIDVQSIGVYEADVLITAVALDHQDYVYEGTERHAKFYLVTDGQEEELGQLEIADPARITVRVPRRGEVVIKTHDTTIWWTTCESLDWKLISIECDDENSSGNLNDKTATFQLEAAETVTCTFTNQKESALLVEKQTNPDADPTRFTYLGDAAGDIADGSQIVLTRLEPGEYASTEKVPSGWKLLNIDCDDGNSSGDVPGKTANFQVEAGEIVKCTFENKKLAATFEAVSQVDDRADDAEERISSGVVSRSGSDLELGEDNGNPQLVGLRFGPVAVPQGAPIIAAYIEFKADETGSEPTALVFHGQAADDAPIFYASDLNISSRPRTTASVSWTDVPPWPTRGATYTTTDLSPVIQEIVDRPGWSQGNALVIIISGTGRRTAESWDGDQDGAPKLHVLYSVTGGCYSLTTDVSPAGSGGVSVSPAPNCLGARYAEGTEVTLTAEPGPNATFSHWSGDASGTDNPTTLTIDGPKSVTANFETLGPLTYEAHVLDDDNAGSSNGNGDGDFDCGETVELSVTLRNEGLVDATGVGATLSTGDSYLQCSSTTSAYPTISGGSTATNDTAFVCTASDITPSTYTAILQLDMTADAGGPWSDSFDVQLSCEGAGVTLDAVVTQDADDAEERVNRGTMIVGGSDLELVEDTALQTVGIRFQNITIPKGATITEAYLTFYADEVHSGETHLTFHGQDADNAPSFGDADGDISGRPKTSASVDWSNVPPWLTVHQAYDTPNLAPIIQEIVNRSGWTSGNSLVIIVTGSGRRVAEAYDGEPTMAPEVHITYSGGTP